MSARSQTVERLRRAFAADDRVAPDFRRCPAPERLWEAMHCEMGVASRRAVVAHLASCPECAVAWRMAMEPETGRAQENDAPSSEVRSASPRRAGWIGLAVAAVLAAAWLGPLLREPTDRQRASTAYRAIASAEIVSLVPEEVALPRDVCVLRWTPAGPGAVYRVEVARETLEPLASIRSLAEPEYRVPAAALAGLAAGESIVWRVQARLPDGRTVSSGAFVNRIE